MLSNRDCCYLGNQMLYLDEKLTQSDVDNDQDQNKYQTMPSPTPMPQHALATHLSLLKFAKRHLESRRQAVLKRCQEVAVIAQEILHEVELREPRFISTLKPVRTNQINSNCTDDINKDFLIDVRNAKFDGLRMISSKEFEVTLYLNQMGVFNFIDDGSIPGGAVLKLSDGRKRSMSLWVEFITASGYLSARKIRARFHSLVSQAVEMCSYNHLLQIMYDNTEVKIKIRDEYTLQMTPTFKCSSLWPRCALKWPDKLPEQIWPTTQLISDVKQEGFNLLSQESVYIRDKQTSVEGDAWLLDFYNAEERILNNGNRRRVLDVLQILVDAKLKSEAITNQMLTDYHLKTFILHECEKHGNDSEWLDEQLADRINGILLQIISCLHHRKCSHYFMPQLDLFRGQSLQVMDHTAKLIWELLRDLIIRPTILDAW